MEDAKKIWDQIEVGKWSEKDLKSLTGLNIGKIKEAKKWMKNNNLIQSYRGRGGYISRLPDAVFPEQESTMTAAEKAAAAREEKRIIKADVARRRQIAQDVIDFVAAQPEAEDSDEISCDYISADNYMAYAWVWHGKSAKGYRIYVDEAQQFVKGINADS